MENLNEIATTVMVPIRRFVDSDNSCLFSSIAYLIDKENFNENSKMIFRLMIVDYINDNDNDISNDILGMDKKDYIEKISQPHTWGGAIELALFSEMFNIMIASMDVMTGRVDMFGEEKDYDRRIYIMYNGVHYDPLVMNLDDTCGNESDITVFSPNDDNTFIMFKDFVESIKSKGDFVDPSNINNMKCGVCNEEFFDEGDAVIHGQNFNHWDFRQI